jgi:TetR/AcrR family transcriptional regulator, regulator of mycofactocin system
MSIPPRQSSEPAAPRGRPPTTSCDEIQRVALRLFVERGFAETTLDDIADAVGVSRRTVFRYYASKGDIVWGAFNEHLNALRRALADIEPDVAAIQAVRDAVVAVNRYRADEMESLRTRVRLMTSVPVLRGHSMRMYAEWCDVIAEFVAGRLQTDTDGHVPRVVANAALGAATATFQHWSRDPDFDLLDGLHRAFDVLASLADSLDGVHPGV